MSVELEILQSSYWEHFKAEKDIALILSVDHPKRIKLRKEINDLTERIQRLKKDDEHDIV